MKLRVLLLCSALISPALAQEPLSMAQTLELSIGQTEALTFEKAVNNVNIAHPGIVTAVPQGDHIVTFSGESVGSTLLFVYGPTGLVYSARINVSAEPGHIVRIYGHGEDVPDYTGFYCTDTFCGRADKELQGIRDPNTKSVTVTRGPGGRFVSTTKSYGRPAQ